ncbi:MAG TPA: DUF362 domain-containing protein [Candidatus Latescibacteria bacterium]|nr:DUF362 domain-containing protein [Candidatus Latescibacterota bacterium]HJP31051.1 DUF362 domain-containing protein [Candidatus Latescibacterota bacterium]
MRLDMECVYLYRTDVEGTTAPFERYREFAREALQRLELPLPETGTILLNPNITVPAAPDSRIITHPGFIAGLVDALLEQGADQDQLLVGEGYGHKKRGHWAQLSGYTQGLGRVGLELIDLDLAGGVEVAIPGGVVFPQLTFARQATECAFYLNVPVAKCHNLSLTTLAMKNTQGTILSPQRHMCAQQTEDEPFADQAHDITERGISLHEERFCHKQSDKTVARLQLGIPQLSVVDGLIGRDGTGFNHGDNRPLGWTIMGASEVLVDVVGTYLMGIDPQATPYLQVAAERGLGTTRIEDIDVVDLTVGDRLDAASLRQLRAQPPLMPMSTVKGKHMPRFRPDGSLVPWQLDRINKHRQEQKLEPIAA